MIERNYLFIPELVLKKQTVGPVLNTEQFVLQKYSNIFPPTLFIYIQMKLLWAKVS